ncbi:MAG: SHOCT domain-containing protein [Prevotellaceae bacterium]|jgi:hypothetical protein|nr:SHOCT domain-containing protein [Prevotellaceae bacterium]
MKKILITFIAIAGLIQMSSAQSDNFAELRNGALYLKNGIVLHETDIISIGKPTGCYENCYENIFHEPTEMIPKIKNKFTKQVYALYSGEKVSVKKIKQITKDGEKIWLITLYYLPKKENLYCYFEQALATGEIIVNKNDNIINKVETTPEIKQENQEQPKQIQQQENNTTNFSIADEIRKLKALLDEGIITKEEFEKQKAKLLE